MALLPTDGHLNFKYLRPGDLRRLEQVHVAPRRLTEGAFAGHFMTAQRGQSVEFRDYREYLPGDDVGHIDWKVFGRSDKLFIRLFEHHAELTVRLLIDASASMAYRGVDPQDFSQPSKYDQACRLAAAIAFLVMKQHDRFGLAIAQNGLRSHLPPQGSARRLTEILRAMERQTLQGQANLADAIHALNSLGARRNLLVAFSDLWDDADRVVQALAARMQRGGEAVVFHILHRDELELPEDDYSLLIDSETGDRLHLDLDAIRADYRAKAEEFVAQWARRCRRLGVDYVRVLTSQPYQTILERYLAHRMAR